MVEKPKRHISYYYDYIQEIQPWLVSKLKNEPFVRGELWKAIQEATEGAMDATVYLDFETLKSCLEDCPDRSCAAYVVEKIMSLLRGLYVDDAKGININIHSWPL